MNNLGQQYNIYCDESSVENDGLHKYMVIGAVIIPRAKKLDLSRKLHKIGVGKTEIKWSRLSNISFPIAKKIVDLFIETAYISFTSIVIDKEKVNYGQFHDGDKELAFYKFYYILLKHNLTSNNKYYIFLDKKPVSVKNRVGVLKSFLTGFIKSSREDCVIKHLQEYSSSENIFIQIADLFTGAVASKANFVEKNKSLVKREFIQHVELKIGRKLTKGTSYFENKFNVFVWKPNNV